MELIVDAGGGLLAVQSGWRDRLNSLVHGERIDRRLAAGSVPEESVVASIRARMLTGARVRRSLLAGLDSAVAAADDRPGRVLSLQLVDRAAVRSARAELQELRDRLTADPLPPAQAIARVRLLLTDGTGPLYNAHAGVDLAASVRRIIDSFDAR